MTIRSLFNIVLKILGILFIKDILVTVPQMLSVVLYFGNPNAIGEGAWTILMLLMVLCAYISVSYYLIFKTDLIINKLRLDQGFDSETIPLNMHRSTVLSISIIIIGGLMVANEIPNLCQQLFMYYQKRRVRYRDTNLSIFYPVLSAAKILVGLLLIGNQRKIVNFIERKRKG